MITRYERCSVLLVPTFHAELTVRNAKYTVLDARLTRRCPCIVGEATYIPSNVMLLELKLSPGVICPAFGNASDPASLRTLYF